MKTLIVGDLHIDEKSISEIEEIFKKDIFPIKADTLIQLGDWFHTNQPTPAEQKFSSDLVKKLKSRYEQVVILSGTGEHDMLRGHSAVEHLESLGAQINIGDLELKGPMLCGHWMLNESKLAFGTGHCGIKDLKEYKQVFLGHQHIQEDITPHIHHVGSVRYVSFGEVGVQKRIMVLEDEQLYSIPLTATVPMINTHDMSILETLEPKCKVRLVYSDFNVYKKEAAEANRIGKRFTQFKIMLDFPVAPNRAVIDHSTVNKDELIINYIKGIKDLEVRKLIEDNI